MNVRPTIVWFRQDLRLRDHPALLAAARRGGPVLPVYVYDPGAGGRWARGAASRAWLHHSLRALTESLEERGSRLVLRLGSPRAVLRELVAATGADAVYWSECYEPAVRQLDDECQRDLEQAECEVRRFNSALLYEPRAIANGQGLPFKVFTPYWRKCQALPPAPPLPLPPRWNAPAEWPRSEQVEALELQPHPRWDARFWDQWTPGETGARAALRRFLRGAVDDYAEARDLPGVSGTSRLSPHLHFGEISPRQVWQAVRQLGKQSGVFPSSRGARVLLTELGWREFAYHQLYHWPTSVETPLRPEFRHFPWRDDAEGRLLQAWQRGRTGYPIVDAGLRELWTTGWMHNRVRMIVASFLVKHLRLNWTAGAAWFWDTLVDADLANNTLGWQWSAGCGTDAAPYFRIFNPVTQGQRFDREGVYVHRWVPELARLPAPVVHAPWTADEGTLAAAGVRLGETYPHPIVEHAAARADALAAFNQLRSRR